jgi:hypothetical protein
MLDVSRTLAALQADLGSARNTTQLIPPAGAVAAGLAAPGLVAPAGLAAASQPPTAELPVVPAVVPGPGVLGPGVPLVEPAPGPVDRPPRRGRAALIGTLVAAALLAGLVVALLLIGNNNNGDNHGPQAGQQTSSAARPSSQHSTPVASSTEPTTPPPSSTAEQSSSGNGNGNGNGNGKGNAPTADQLAQAITDYYALLPDNTDEAWDRLTKRYQDGTAKSRENFQSFWDQMSSVSTSDVTGTAPDSAEATITYTFKDGKVVVERTAFTLVRQGDILKIDSSDVLDSQTQ